MNSLLLRNKNAVVYGGGGAIGGAVARAFAREGAKVFLAGRTAAKLDVVAREIVAAGGSASVTELDALNEAAVNKHVDRVAAKAGGIDINLWSGIVMIVVAALFALWAWLRPLVPPGERR